jgi:hypothetical protein
MTEDRVDYLNSYFEFKKSIKVFTEGLVIYTVDKGNFKDPSYSFIPLTKEQIAKLRPQKGQLMKKHMRSTISKSKSVNVAPYLDITSSEIKRNGSIDIVLELKGHAKSYLMYLGNLFSINYTKNGVNSIQTVLRDKQQISNTFQVFPNIATETHKMIISQNDNEPIFRLYNRGKNGQLKEYELFRAC